MASFGHLPRVQARVKYKGVKPMSEVCPHCKKEFATTQAPASHIRFAHKSPAPPTAPPPPTGSPVQKEEVADCGSASVTESDAEGCDHGTEVK